MYAVAGLGYNCRAGIRQGRSHCRGQRTKLRVERTRQGAARQPQLGQACVQRLLRPGAQAAQAVRQARSPGFAAARRAAPPASRPASAPGWPRAAGSQRSTNAGTPSRSINAASSSSAATRAARSSGVASPGEALSSTSAPTRCGWAAQDAAPPARPSNSRAHAPAPRPADPAGAARSATVALHPVARRVRRRVRLPMPQQIDGNRGEERPCHAANAAPRSRCCR